MADVNSNIQVNIDASEALASLKALQRQISAFHSSMAKSGAAANAVTSNMQQNLLNSINASGKFQASFKTIATTTESFTRSLEKNQLSMGQYFKYAGASTKTFGKLFKSEFDTINKVARERVKDLQTQYIKLGRDANGAMKSIAVRPLTLDMKNLGTQTAIAAQRQQLLNQLLKQGSTNLLNFGKNTQWAGRQLMVGFTVPLAMVGSAAAKTFMQLEEQAIRFKRVYGEMFTTTKETDDMLKQIQLLGKEFTKYGVSVEKTMEMAANAAASGKMGADLLAQVSEATRLAVLGGVEQAQALETTISLTNAFGIATEELTKKINFLNAVENQTVVSIEDLTIAVPKAGPVVQQLGGDVEDLAFFLTAMKEGGINASEGANALKSGLAALINPTAKASEMLQGFGINIKAIVEGNAGNVKQTVIDFASALDTLDPLNRARAIEQLFGKFQFSRLSTLFQNVIKDGSQASRVLELTMATQEELAILSERELKRIEESTSYKFKNAIENLKVSIAPVGEEFLKALTPVVKFVGDILEKFNNLGDGTKKFVVILTAVLGGIGPILLMSFGLLANGLANIIKLFAGVKSVFNRAGQSSQVLGQQTDYMTQEQIQAATVAASLEQVHAKLIQTFTVEATAVQALATAYKNAVAAQLAFTGPAGRGVPKRQGLNRGTTKVKYYAKGTDTVPAMLTPGEAVIPADSAQNPKNKKAIATMVAGGVVGYAGGTVNVGAQGYGLSGGTQSTMASIQRAIDASIGQIDDIIAQALQNLAGETKISIDKFKNEVRALAKQQGVKAPEAFAKKYETRTKSYNAAGAGERRTVPKQLEAERGAPAAAAELARANAAAKAIEKELIRLGATSSQITNAIQLDRSHMVELNNEQKKVLQAWNSNLWTVQTGAENNSILDTLRKSQKTNQRIFNTYKEYLVQTGATTEQINGIVANITKGVALTDDQLSIQGKALRAMGAEAAKSDKARIALEKRSTKNFVMYATAVGEGQLAREKAMASESEATKRLIVRNKKAIQDIVNQLPDAAAVTLQTKSPSRKMRKIGQDAGAGLILGAREFVDDAKVAGQQIGAAASDGLTQGGRTRRVATRAQGPAPIGVAAPAGANLLPIVAGDPKAQPKGRIGTYLANRTAKREAAGKTGMGAGGGMMAASGVMMAASMAPGKVGETAQKLMMPMMALTMALPLLQSKVGALTLGIGLLTAAAISARMAFDKAQDSALKLGEAMGAGSESIKSLSEFAGNASAGEIMGRRRKESLSPFQIQTGKTTFGESFMAGERGKAMAANVGQTIKSSGQAAAQGQIVNQLATGVAAGAITAAQARSIVANLAQELGDYTFGIQVNGKLMELIGPNGENLAKDPLGVRVKLLQDTRERMNLANTALGTAGKTTGTDRAKGVGYSLGGAAAGAGAGFIAAGAGAAATGMAVGSVVPVVGTIIGAALGLGVGAFLAQRDKNKRVGEASGASIALQKVALQQQQEMLDSLDLEYQQKIANAKAAGNQAEAERLTNEYLKNRNGLLTENGKLVSTIQKNFAGADKSLQGALMTGADKAITKQYKGTALEDVAPLAKTLIEDSGTSKELQYTLKMQLATGQIDPMQMMEIFDTFGKDKAAINKVINVIGKFGGAFANQMMGVVGLFKDKQQATDFVARISTKTAPEAQKELELFQRISQIGQVVPVDIALNFYNKNPKAAAKLQTTIDSINDQKGKINLQIATKILGAKEMDVLRNNQEYFNSLPPEQQKVYLQTLTTMVNMAGNNKDAIQNWLKANPGKTEGDYYAESAYKITVASKDTTTPNAQTPPPGAGSKKGPDASSLDDLVKKLKEIQKNQIKVTVGYAASMKALKAFADTGKTMPFSGIEQDIMSMKGANVGTNFLEFILGMDPAEYEKKKKDIFKFDNKGNITGLAKDGKVIRTILESITAGEFQAGLVKQKNDLEDQNNAFTKLRSLGVPVAQAYDLISNAAFANMIATTKNKDKVKELIKQYKEFLALRQESDKTEAFNLKLDEVNKLPQTVQDQQVAIANLMSQGASYAAAWSFVEDSQVATRVAGEKNIEVLKGIATAAKLAEEATRKFGIQQQFNSKMTDLKNTLDNLKDQRVAIAKLVSLGFSYADAYSIVQDAAVAATIAQTTNNKVIIETGNLAKRTALELKNMAAAMGVVNLNQQTQDRKALLAFIQTNKGILSNDTIKALLENSELATLMLDPTIDPAALQQALDDIANAADTELKIKKLTIEGMEDIFNDGFSKAMEAFDAEEKAIQLKFNVDNKSLIDIEEGIIPVAEAAIAALQYQIDDWEAGLKDIEDQEKNINDTYDDKFKALDQVQKINEKIARQQKQQLTLADALSQGDISAAAVAIQEMRASNAADQVGAQREGLEAAKENQLANVRNALGQTRKQIEEQIKKLQKEIFDIEEKTLEPAKEKLRLAERERDIQISNITVLGLTKAAWEAQKNAIDLAKTSSEAYNTAMAGALKIVTDIVDHWTNKVPAKKTTIHEIITKYGTEGSLSDCCGKDITPDPEDPVIPDPPKLTYCPSLGRNVPSEGFPGNCPGAESSGKPNPDPVVPKSPCPAGMKMGLNDKCIPDTTPKVADPGVNKNPCPAGMKMGLNDKCIPDTNTKSSRPSDPSSVVQLHFDDLEKIAADAKKNLMLFNQKMNVAEVTKNAGSTPGMHLADLYKLQNDLVVQKAMAPTPGMLAQEAAAKTGIANKPILSNTQVATVAKIAKESTVASSHVADLLAQQNKATAAATAKKAADAAAAKKAADLKKFGGNAAAAGAFANWNTKYSGGMIKRFAVGGKVIGTDVVPSMLTPGEFVVSRPAVREYGVDKLKAINSQAYDDSAVYNYNLSVNMNGSDLDANDVATVVLQKIKQLDSQRLRRQK